MEYSEKEQRIKLIAESIDKLPPEKQEGFCIGLIMLAAFYGSDKISFNSKIEDKNMNTGR